MQEPTSYYFLSFLFTIIFLYSAFIDWKEIEPYNYIQIAVGFLNVFQWTLVLVLPVIQVTHTHTHTHTRTHTHTHTHTHAHV